VSFTASVGTYVLAQTGSWARRSPRTSPPARITSSSPAMVLMATSAPTRSRAPRRRRVRALPPTLAAAIPLSKVALSRSPAQPAAAPVSPTPGISTATASSAKPAPRPCTVTKPVLAPRSLQTASTAPRPTQSRSR
jgi:hypothetical protein